MPRLHCVIMADNIDRNPAFGIEESIVLTVEQTGLRLDRYLVTRLSGRSRTKIQRWIKEGRVTVDGAVSRANHRVTAGEQVVVHVPHPETRELLPEPIPLDLVYEDEDLVVTAKVLPENTEVYKTLISFGEGKGLSPEEINTKLFNAGLVIWVEQINRQLDEGPTEADDDMPVEE